MNATRATAPRWRAPTAIRNHLLAERRAILGRVARTEHELRALGAHVESETADEAQEETATALLLRLDDRAHGELQAIDAALARLDGGTYGICTACGGPIAVDRLIASPTAGRCIDCARAAG